MTARGPCALRGRRTRRIIARMGSYRERFPEFRDRFMAESHFLHLVLPSVVRPGERFALRAVMMDSAGMPAEGYRGRIPLTPSEPDLEVPEAIEFGPDDLGAVTVEGLVAAREGAFYVTATPDLCPGQPPRSNAVRVRADGPRLFWGDIHVHTVLGNCHPDHCKSPDFAYWYAREVALLDFCAVTDHLRGIHRIDSHWAETTETAGRHNDPGRFATFLAFESSHAVGFGGDNNIYYNADAAGHFWREREDMTGIAPKVGLDELWAWLDGQGIPYLSVPHHTGRAGKFRSFEEPWHNPARETVMEVYSWWGSSEGRRDDVYLKGGKADARAYWTDALELGYRYGAIASSDTHHTMPGTPYPVNAENYAYAQHRLNCQGLAGVYADRLERGALFDALLGRRCFGTTWWRPAVEFSVCGVEMGQKVAADPAVRRAREVRATVAASRGGSITLLRNNRPIARARLEPPLTQFTFADEEPLDDVLITGAPKNPEPFAFYYLKLEQNGQLAWTSPVWVTA